MVLKSVHGAYHSTRLFAEVISIGGRALAVFMALLIIFSLLVGATRCDKAEESENEIKTEGVSSRTSVTEGERGDYTALNYRVTKAVWLSQFDMTWIYTDGVVQRDIADYTARVGQVVENIKSLGMNTVIIQLRPNGDSIYPSELYPTSKYLTGEYGREADYDAFDVFLEVAHGAGLSVHAWINPLRCMSEIEISSVPMEYAVRRWYAEENGRYTVAVGGVCYFNPAYGEVRSLICDGVGEILDRYEVDGIHIDDYFYPTTAESFDAEAYSAYVGGGGILSLADFRREQINTLVRDIYATVKNRNHTVLFGVSPGGNNDRNYNELYADVAKWCANEGYIDYLCPQVYFGFEHESRPFDKVCEEFSNMIKTDSITLIVGMTLGKAYGGYSGEVDAWAGSGSREWIENRDILRRSLEYIQTMDKCGGTAFFSYQYFFDVQSGEGVPGTSDEITAFLPLLKKM